MVLAACALDPKKAKDVKESGWICFGSIFVFTGIMIAYCLGICWFSEFLFEMSGLTSTLMGYSSGAFAMLAMVILCVWILAAGQIRFKNRKFIID